jgi:cobalt transporter subunit CbtB
MAALLGAFLIFGVGFSHVSAFHNAAHDVRHSNAFPCH